MKSSLQNVCPLFKRLPGCCRTCVIRSQGARQSRARGPAAAPVYLQISGWFDLNEVHIMPLFYVPRELLAKRCSLNCPIFMEVDFDFWQPFILLACHLGNFYWMLSVTISNSSVQISRNFLFLFFLFFCFGSLSPHPLELFKLILLELIPQRKNTSRGSTMQP